MEHADRQVEAPRLASRHPAIPELQRYDSGLNEDKRRHPVRTRWALFRLRISAKYLKA